MAIAEKTDFTADGAGIATGKNFAEALAGGSLADSRGSIVLLADSAEAVTIGALEDNAKSIDYITVLGGERRARHGVRCRAEGRQPLEAARGGSDGRIASRRSRYSFEDG